MSPKMPLGKFIFLLALVIGAAGLSIWVAVLAAEAGALDGNVLRALLPLLLLAGVAVRALCKGSSG